MEDDDCEDKANADPGGTRSYLLGMRALDGGDKAGAEVHFQRSLAEAPHFKTYERLGELAAERRDFVAATTYFAAAAALGPQQSRARYLLAEVLVARGALESAAAALEEALAINPDYKRARALLEELRTRDEPHKSRD